VQPPTDAVSRADAQRAPCAGMQVREQPFTLDAHHPRDQREDQQGGALPIPGGRSCQTAAT
jgi:hypothetical protein